MKVRDLIGGRSEVYSIQDGATVHEAAQYLRERQVRAVGVLDAVQTFEQQGPPEQIDQSLRTYADFVTRQYALAAKHSQRKS